MAPTKIYDGEWVVAKRVKTLACCDCGLTHLIRHRVRKGKIEWQFFRDRAETRNERRRTGRTWAKR